MKPCAAAFVRLAAKLQRRIAQRHRSMQAEHPGEQRFFFTIGMTYEVHVFANSCFHHRFAVAIRNLVGVAAADSCFFTGFGQGKEAVLHCTGTGMMIEDRRRAVFDAIDHDR